MVSPPPRGAGGMRGVCFCLSLVTSWNDYDQGNAILGVSIAAGSLKCSINQSTYVLTPTFWLFVQFIAEPFSLVQSVCMQVHHFCSKCELKIFTLFTSSPIKSIDHSFPWRPPCICTMLPCESLGCIDLAPSDAEEEHSSQHNSVGEASPISWDLTWR
jgi:hypothetical protein